MFLASVLIGSALAAGGCSPRCTAQEEMSDAQSSFENAGYAQGSTLFEECTAQTVAELERACDTSNSD